MALQWKVSVTCKIRFDQVQPIKDLAQNILECGETKCMWLTREHSLGESFNDENITPCGSFMGFLPQWKKVHKNIDDNLFVVFFERSQILRW